MPEAISACPSGIFPAWIPAGEFVPDSPRVVLVSDGESVRMGCYVKENVGDMFLATWVSAETEAEFDDVILEWMESPVPSAMQ